ncbi:MAG: hypothetical protein JSR24_06750 [Proteobacteria bacterium]|nr:hypothetical protein [Pseudomonadota bacterium]
MTDAALAPDLLGALLGALASRPGAVPKHLYPSAGTLYPVQAYVILRNAAAQAPAGSHYYDPDTHELASLSSETPSAPDGSTPTVLLLLAAQRAAIAPVYGEEAEAFCLLEAGYMTEVLRNAADGLALRDAGDPATHADLIRACRLEDSHLPLVCLAVEETKR